MLEPPEGSTKEARLVERDVCFILEAGNVGRVDPCPKTNSPHPQLTITGQELYRRREGATCRNSTVSSDSRPQTGPQGSDQHHLDCFQYSYPSAPESVCFHFLRLVLGTVEAYVMGTVWSSYS